MSNGLSFSIGIPTINSFDLLFPSLLLYSLNFPDTDIFIYDNGKQFVSDRIKAVNSRIQSIYPSLKNVKVLGGSGENIGVAGAWNELCSASKSRGHSHTMILNDDVYWEYHGGEQGRMQRVLEFFTEMSACEKKYDLSVFVMPSSVFEDMRFDKNFYPAYYEDNDYEYRLSLMGRRIERTDFLNPVVFRRSMSLLKGDGAIQEHKGKSQEYYIKKWGGDVGHEKYKTPFGV